MVKRIQQEAIPSHLDTLRAEILSHLGHIAELAPRIMAFDVVLDPPATQAQINSAEDSLCEYYQGFIDVELDPLEPTPTRRVNVVLVHLKNQ